MNFANSQVIRHGPRAGQPRPISDIVLDGITAAREIAIRLKRNGFTIINCVVGSGLTISSSSPVQNAAWNRPTWA